MTKLLLIVIDESVSSRRFMHRAALFINLIFIDWCQRADRGGRGASTFKGTITAVIGGQRPGPGPRSHQGAATSTATRLPGKTTALVYRPARNLSSREFYCYIFAVWSNYRTKNHPINVFMQPSVHLPAPSCASTFKFRILTSLIFRIGEPRFWIAYSRGSRGLFKLGQCRNSWDTLIASTRMAVICRLWSGRNKLDALRSSGAGAGANVTQFCQLTPRSCRFVCCCAVPRRIIEADYTAAALSINICNSKHLWRLGGW